MPTLSIATFVSGLFVAPMLYAIAHGFALVHGTEDRRKIELETPMYDALYAWCQEEARSSA